MCGQFPADPTRVKAGGTGCETEKGKKIRLSLFIFPGLMLNLFPPPTLFPPSWSFVVAFTCIFQDRGAKIRLSLHGGTDGRRRKAEPTRRSARQTRGVGSWGKGWGGGVQGPLQTWQPAAPAPLKPWRST